MKSIPTWPQDMLDPRVTVKPLTGELWLDVEYLALHMREIDKIEIYNNCKAANFLELTTFLMTAHTQNHGIGWLIYYNNSPIAVGGFYECWRGVWEAWAFGTDDWRKSAIVFLNQLDKGQEYLIEHKCHRIQCRSHERHTEAHAYLSIIGATREAVLKHYGSDGADYFAYSWTGITNERRIFKGRVSPKLPETDDRIFVDRY